MESAPSLIEVEFVEGFVIWGRQGIILSAQTRQIDKWTNVYCKDSRNGPAPLLSNVGEEDH